ncbi:MAG: hypothetical protein E7408_01330 [Ruminococcaceae bacterium]|nr:hypothetical protein [Oscillospiraceae bacterium]
MEELQLRKTMGGYKREDVASYIDAMVKRYEDMLVQEQEATKAAKAEAAAAVQENAKLFARVSEMESERDSVSRAVIAAQREADALLEAAREKGKEIVLEKEKEAVQLEEQMTALRNEIRTLRLQAAAALRRYEATLTTLVPDGDDEE